MIRKAGNDMDKNTKRGRLYILLDLTDAKIHKIFSSQSRKAPKTDF